MHIELIYTYDRNHDSQTTVIYPFVDELLASEGVFTRFVTALLTDDEKHDLRKISSCVYYASNAVKTCEWFVKCNGKLYFENGYTKGKQFADSMGLGSIMYFPQFETGGEMNKQKLIDYLAEQITQCRENLAGIPSRSNPAHVFISGEQKAYQDTLDRVNAGEFNEQEEK